MGRLYLDWNGATELLMCHNYLDQCDSSAILASFGHDDGIRYDDDLIKKLRFVFALGHPDKFEEVNPFSSFPELEYWMKPQNKYDFDENNELILLPSMEYIRIFRNLMKLLKKSKITEKQFEEIKSFWGKQRADYKISSMVKVYDLLKKMRNVEDGPIPL